MNTKEAIRFVDQHIRRAYYMGVPERMKGDDIIKLLQRGKKYEAMWKELFKYFSTSPEERNISKYSYMLDMKNIEQKYFPKPEKNDKLEKRI